MGSILSAKDQRLKRTVALKVLLLDAHADEMQRRRFLREAEVLAMLAHPNIVPVYDIVWEDGMPLFYAMKMVKGRTLEEILHDLRKKDPETLREYSLDRLLLIFRKVCDALAFAHSKGVLHRDLKPANVMIGEFGEVLVMDWGLAKVLGEEFKTAEPAKPVDKVAGHFPGRTLDGEVMGTPEYMSPEQATGQVEVLDERSDIYALGAMLYAILTLRPPVSGGEASEILERVRGGKITSPRDLQTGVQNRRKSGGEGGAPEFSHAGAFAHIVGGRVPSALSSIVMQAMHLDKAKRYASVTALASDIESYQGGFATSAERVGTLKQIRLLMLRHKAVSFALAALLIISIGFTLKVMGSERRATRNAEIAEVNEQLARESSEESRRSLARAQVSIAEAAFRRADLAGMVSALEETPDDLRDQSWDYFSAKRDSSMGFLRVDGFANPTSLCALPHHPGHFALASEGGLIGIVDVARGSLLRTLETGESGDQRVAISGDGQRLLSITRGSTKARLFNPVTGEEFQTLEILPDLEPLNNRFFSIALNPTGSLAAVSNLERSIIQIIETNSGTVRWSLKGNPERLQFHPTEPLIYSLARHQRIVEIFNTDTGEQIAGLRVNPASLACSPDGSKMAIGLYDGGVIIIDAITGRELRRAKLHSGCVCVVAWTAGGHLLTLGGEGRYHGNSKSLRMWESITFSPRGTFLGTQALGIYLDAGFDSAGGYLLTHQSPPQLWKIDDAPLSRVPQLTEQAWSCNFLSDTVLLGREGYNLMCYDVTDPRNPIAPEVPLRKGHMLATVHPASGVFVITNPYPNNLGENLPMVKVMQLTPNGLTEKWEHRIHRETLSMDLDAEAKQLVLATKPDGLLVFDVATGETLADLPIAPYRAVFAGSHGMIAGLDRPRSNELQSEDRVILIDPKDGQIRKSVSVPNRLNAIAVSPDRSLIAVAGDDQMVLILDADTLAERYRFRAHDAVITALKFHPGLPILATGSSDYSIKLWDYQKAELRKTISGLEGSPVMLTFSPTGRLLAEDGMSEAFHIYDLSELYD